MSTLDEGVKKGMSKMLQTILVISGYTYQLSIYTIHTRNNMR